MKTKRLLSAIGASAMLLCGLSANAQTIKTWTGASGDFFDPARWDAGIPTGTDIAVINNGGTATIGATAGARTFGGLRLGDVEGGTEVGHVIMNGGTLTIGSATGDPNQVLIGLSAVRSTFIMNGGTIMLDAPETGGLNTSFKGANEIDWEVGLRGLGRFEMHGDSRFFASDDLKVAENALGNGEVVIDGNARVAVGSGISISSGGTNEQTMVIGGNARVDSGNSMGAGNPQGGTDEGYLTMAIGNGRGKLTIQDNGILNIRRLSAREGVSTIIVKNNGQFHIFDVLNGAGTNAASRPPETGPNSAYGSANTSDATMILQDDAQMTVNSDPASGPTKGLGISAQRDANNAGGIAKLTIQDRASLRIQQDLMLGTGANPLTSDGTLEVVGPNAIINIGGNLNMAVDLEGNIAAADEGGTPTPGKSTLSAVINGSTHSTVNVAGIARIGQGRLKVKTTGAAPASGTIYTLIQGGTIEGQFRETDFTEAPLAAGQTWQVEYAANAVRLRVAGPAAGRVLTVTTANNVNPPAGSVSLLQAMTGLQNGDTIRFNIAGNGPHFIETPAGGYPLITAHNVTIDGYSQPGSSPNTNSILAANNAQIRIVLDSRNGNVRLMDFAPTSPTDQTGYGDTEAATIGILSATNVTIRGLSIVSVPLLPPETGVYGISFAKGASGHVNGCWIGVAPDGTTIAGPADGITGFRYRVRDENNTVLQDILVNNVIIGVKAGSTNATAEFNVLLGIPAIPVIIEGNGTRFAGNFFNVYPTGDRDFNPPLVNPDIFSGTFEGNIEIGRGGNNTVIGVDGDGVNDANERNIFSGVLPESQGGYDHNIEFYGQTPGTNIVIAGNYFGVAVNGTTRFTNGVPVLNAAGGSAQYRFGSDFDGVSDALEGNVVYNNWPPEMFPTTGSEGFFDELSTGGIVGARGNVFVNNFPFPVSPLRDAGGFWTTYYTKALVDPAAGVVPVLSTNTTLTRLVGTVPIANADYPVTIIDLYAADPEGIAYGQTAAVPELPNGYVQGKSYIGSFVDNSAADANKTAGQFDFNISGLEVTGTRLTITANYSKSPAGTRNAIVLTSPFSDPVEVAFTPGSVESVGLTRVVADRPVIPTTADALGNWEPYASVVGTNFFVVEANTFATDTTDKQRYVVIAQQVGADISNTLQGFHGDTGAVYTGEINLSRQNGNPGRVAGDKRPGAVNFIVGGEASPHGYPQFTTDNRWNVNEAYAGDNRYAVVQTFALTPAGTVGFTPLSRVIDPVLGGITAPFSGNVPEVSRFGGDLVALDNGNFVVVIDDRSNLIAPRRTATAAIITPTGTVVKSGFAIDAEVDNQIWSNVAAYRGGFAARFNGTIYFFDNAGNLRGEINQDAAGEAFDRGRGDGTRITAHINSPFVFLAGGTTPVGGRNTEVKVAAFDSRDFSFAGKALVSEGAFPAGATGYDRVNVASDALDRLVVAYEAVAPGFNKPQTVTRVLAYNGATDSFTPLTSSFYPFANSVPGTAAAPSEIRAFRPSLAMTTTHILVAAKGEINLQNRPAEGPNSPLELNFYTVFTHPDPENDPTPRAGAAGDLRLTIERAGANSIRLSWTGGTGPFLVQKKANLNDAVWMNVLTTSENSALVPNDGTTGFFRVQSGATNNVVALSAFMGGIFERPSTNNSPGRGLGTFSIEGNRLSYDIAYSGLTAAANAAHIHGFGTTEDARGVAIGFTGPFGTSGRITGIATLTEEQRTNILAGRTYANIHTPNNTGGEIRGQIMPLNLRATLNGANERPTPVNTTATGTGKFTLAGNELFVDVSYSGLQGTANNAHIHGPAGPEGFAGVLVGMNGLHVGPFGTSGRFLGSVVLSPQHLNNVIDGQTYFNIHSTAHGGGEIRGQIVP